MVVQQFEVAGRERTRVGSKCFPYKNKKRKREERADNSHLFLEHLRKWERAGCDGKDPDYSLFAFLWQINYQKPEVWRMAPFKVSLFDPTKLNEEQQRKRETKFAT